MVSGRHVPEDRSETPPSVDSGMHFQVTVRYGSRYQRYHTYVVEATDAAAALTTAAAQMPTDIAADVDLVELRIAADPETREYVEEDAP